MYIDLTGFYTILPCIHRMMFEKAFPNCPKFIDRHIYLIKDIYKIYIDLLTIK